MLRPIVEAAGYRVIGERGRADADLVIVSQGAKSTERRGRPDDLAAHRARRRRRRRTSIYRYDRAGLLMALKSAGAGRGMMNEFCWS